MATAAIDIISSGTAIAARPRMFTTDGLASLTCNCCMHRHVVVSLIVLITAPHRPVTTTTAVAAAIAGQTPTIVVSISVVVVVTNDFAIL